MGIGNLLFLALACVSCWLSGVLYGQGRRRSTVVGILAAGLSFGTQALVTTRTVFSTVLVVLLVVNGLIVLATYGYTFGPDTLARLRHFRGMRVRHG